VTFATAFLNRESIFLQGNNPESRSGAVQAQDILLPIDTFQMPTAKDIEEYLPRNLHPVFEFADDAKRAVIPTFVTISPVLVHSVMGEFFLKDGGTTSQKYLELKPAEKDNEEEQPFNSIVLSVANIMPDDVGTLINFRDKYPPNTEFSLKLPVYPNDEWRKMAVGNYQRTRELTAAEAAEYDKHNIEGGASSLAGRDTGAYFVTFDTSEEYIRPVR
jgi:hypothetical protein